MTKAVISSRILGSLMVNAAQVVESLNGLWPDLLRKLLVQSLSGL